MQLSVYSTSLFRVSDAFTVVKATSIQFAALSKLTQSDLDNGPARQQAFTLSMGSEWKWKQIGYRAGFGYRQEYND